MSLPVQDSSRQSTILVVDDTPENIDVLAGLLSEEYAVKVAMSGEKALELANQEPIPDLILLDVMMPGMDGYEVCRLLKGNPATANIPVIFLTAKDETEDETKGLGLGAADYILKPVSPPILEARVKTHLTLKANMEQLRQARKEVEKRNRFIKQTFGRYLSDDIVESILETPKGMDLGGEERKVTILMSDIRGFSSLAQRLPPDNVVSMLNIYLEAMTDIILKHKGTIDEFIGDAILVIFGAPLAYGSDPKRAVACAVEMQLAMEDVNARFREANLPEIGMGIGLRTGEVVVGNIGSSKRSKYVALIGPQPSSSRPWVLKINHPLSRARSFSISRSMACSQFPGPKLVHVSFVGPLCGDALIAPPPVLNALTWVGNHASNSGVEAL